MPTYIVDNFKAGVDVRRPAYAAQPGTLQRGVNIHFTRGGDPEVRKAFATAYALPAGTFGMAQQEDGLYVFGSIATPVGIPAGVTYQRLEHPGGAAMTGVLKVELFGGKLYVVAKYDDQSIHHFYDGANVTNWFDGRARGAFTVTAGTANAGVNKVSDITVNGVSVIGAAVDWATSHSATATAIAAAINLEASSPDYSAVAVGPTVTVLAEASAGAGPNGFPIVVSVGGDVLVSAPGELAGGVGTGTDTYSPGTSVRTVDQKMYAVSGRNLHGSALGDPTEWNTDADGAFFNDVSTYSAENGALVGLDPFYNRLVVFGRTGLQVWTIDVDPLNNRRFQSIPDIGLVGANATKPTRDGALTFLSDMGVKLLQTRDSQGRAGVSDLSDAIDPLLVPAVAAATEAQRSGAILAIDPESGRLWVIIGSTIYVYSHYPQMGVSAWTQYELAFEVSDVAVALRRIYVRSGDTIYIYGGFDNVTYEAVEAVLVVPYITARAPGTFKNLHSVDYGVDGTWEAYVLIDSNEPDGAAELIDIFEGQTYDKPAGLVAASGTHLSVKLVHNAAEYGRVCGIALHYETDAAPKA